MLVKLIDCHCGDLAFLEPDGDSHALPVRLISDVPNAANYFIPDEFGNLFDQLGFIDLVGKFGDDEGFPLGALIFLDQYSAPYANAAPAGMIGASNFFELAVAVAVSVFGLKSAAALATIVGVLVEVPVMLTLVAIANKTRHWFPENR